LKFGVFCERDSKTEPGSNNYNGTYDFGHSADNPLSTGNGYANALLGNFTQYSELTNRVDQENVHWQTDAYAQDTWRVGPRFTLDYGVRVTHAGAVYEVRDMNSGFDPAKWDPKQAPVLFQAVLQAQRGSRQPVRVRRPTARRSTRSPARSLSQAYAGRTVPGSGSIVNGMFAGGLPGKKAGLVLRHARTLVGPARRDRLGCEGRPEDRHPRVGGNLLQLHQPRPVPLQRRRVDRAHATPSSTTTSVTSRGSPRPARSSSRAPRRATCQAGAHARPARQADGTGKLEPEKNYQANVAFQRDLGFHTVAEIAWVGNFGRHFWRMKTGNNIEPYAYANLNNLFRNEPMSANFLRRDYPGMGNTRYLATNEDILNYNAMQLQVQRRLHKGLQMGIAYTLSKNEGVQGWDYLHRGVVRQGRAARPVLRAAVAVAGPGSADTSWRSTTATRSRRPSPSR
jgi:hypothetical protein